MKACVWLFSAAIASVLVAWGASCRPPSPTSGGSNFDVYVPMPEDGGEGGPQAEAGEGGFGLGQVDRAGRPLVSVLLVPTSLQDTYNAEPSFEAIPPRLVQDAIEARLVELDTLKLQEGGANDQVDWAVPEGGVHPLQPMLLVDALLVDTGQPCTGADGGFVTSYLDIEHEAFSFDTDGGVHGTCGGRTPNEPVVDETLTLLVTADRDGGPVVTQGVAAPTRVATTTFPYLAPPN